MAIKDGSDNTNSQSKGTSSNLGSDADLTSRDANIAINNMRSKRGADTAGVSDNATQGLLEFTPLNDPNGIATARRRNGFFENMANRAVSDTQSDTPNTAPNDAPNAHSRPDHAPAESHSYSQQGSLNAMESSHDQPQRRNEHSVLVNGDRRFPVMAPQRSLAKAELDANEKKWGSGNLSEQEKKAVHDIQNAVLGGTFDAFATAIQALGNNPEKLSQALEEAQRNIQLAGGNVGLALSDGKAYLFGDNSKFAVQVDPETGNSAVKPITREDGVVTVGSGEVISKTPQAEFKAISDDAVREVAPLPIIRDTSPKNSINMYPSTPIPPIPEPVRMDPIPRKYR